MARNKKPQEMTELVISNEQFKNSSGMVDAMMASNAHKFVAEMKLVAEAVLETGEKLLVGRRKINEATGGFTQSFYVPADKADLITRNINVRRDSYRNRDDLAERIDNLGHAEVITGRRDVVMAERRYDYESANARRLGVRDIHAAGGLADKAKYRDVDHPYATAMYLPLDKAAYDARSGRSRSGWVQSQFNSAMTGESRNERTFARDQQSRAEAERQQKEADRQARESQRAAEKKARAQAQAQKQQQRERERQQKAAEREEARRKKEEQRAEEKSNRERLALFAKIGVMLASVVALIRGISTSLLGAMGKAAGSTQGRLPDGFDLSTPVADGLIDAISKVDFTGIFAPLVKAVTETVQKIREETLAGYRSGLTTADVRMYDLNDVAHQLAAGTTVSGMIGLAQNTKNIVTLAKENNLGDDYAKMILGSGLLTELVDYSMGEGGYTTAGVFEDIIDAYFKQFLSGKNALGHPVARELLMAELKDSVASLMGKDAASVLGNMMLNSMDSYYAPFTNFEGWMSSTRTMQLMQQGAFAISPEKLAYANVQSQHMSDIEAQLQAVFDKFLAGFTRVFDDILETLQGISYYFMDESDKLTVDTMNRQRNKDKYAELSAREKAARAAAVQALGVSEKTLTGSTSLTTGLGGEVYVGPTLFLDNMSDEQIARYMEWAQLYGLTEQAKRDAETASGRVKYRETKYTPEGAAAYKLDMLEKYLLRMQAGRVSNLERELGGQGFRDVTEDTLVKFFEWAGYSGSPIDVINSLITGATGAGESYGNYKDQTLNLTDLLDQVISDANGKTGRVDYSLAEVKGYFSSERWTKLSGAEKVRAFIKALGNVTDRGTTNLSTVGTTFSEYSGAMDMVLAAQAYENAMRIMGYDLALPVTDTAGQAAAQASAAAAQAAADAKRSQGTADRYEMEAEIMEQLEAYYMKLWGKDYGNLLRYGGTDMAGNAIPSLSAGINYNIIGQRETGKEDIVTLRVVLDKNLAGQLDGQPQMEDFDFNLANNTLTIRENK